MHDPDGYLIARRRVRARTQQMYSLASSVTVLNYRVRHHHCGVSFASFVNGVGTVARLWGFLRPPFNVLR